MSLIKFYPGDNTEIILNIDHIANFPKDKKGNCAFCHGLENWEKKRTKIYNYFKKNPHEITCPCCHGKSS